MSFLASLLNPRAASPSDSDDWWYSIPGVSTASGARVNETSAMRTSAVFSCVKVLAESVGQLPLHVYRREGDTRRRDESHWLNRLIVYPNPRNTGSEFRETLQGHVSLRGNAYAVIEVGNNRAVEALWPMHPDHVTVRQDENRNLLYEYQEPDSIARTGQRTTFLQGEVYHLRGLSDDGIMGLSPIAMMRESVGIALAAEEYGARFFANDTQGGVVVEAPYTFKDSEHVDRFKQSWNAASLGANRHKVRVLEGGAKIAKLGLTNTDAQFLESRKFQVSDIARAFRVPPHMIGDLERATFSNIEHQAIEFVQHTLGPWLNKWEEGFTRSMLGESNTGVFVEYLVDALLRGDIKSRYEAYASGINSQWLAPNEVRKRENLNPLDGLDEPIQPLNTAPRDGSVDQQARAIVQREADALRASLNEHGASSKFINSMREIYSGVAAELKDAGLSEFAAMAYCEVGKRIVNASQDLPALIESLAEEREAELVEIMRRKQ